MNYRLMIFSLALLQPALSGCEEISGSLTLELDRPSGLAIVDDGWFIVGQENGDVASFVSLDPSSGVAEELMSPSFYLPLSIGIAPEARSWIGSPNQAALYVSGLTGEVELLSFNRIRNGDGVSATSRSDDFFADSVGMLTKSPSVCELPCVVRAWATLPTLGKVVEFEITEAGEGFLWTLLREVEVGGSPWELTISSDDAFILGSDLSDQRIFKVTLASGDVETVDMGSVIGPIRLTTNGENLLVTRPDLRDAIVLSVADMSRSQVSNFLAPDTSCVAACNPESSLPKCEGLHPYNRQVCMNDFNQLQSAGTYDGIYLDLRTSHVVAMGEGAGDPAWVSTCDEADRSYSEVFIVLGLQSGMRFIGQHQDTGTFELITDSWCKSLRQGATSRPEVLVSALGSPMDLLEPSEDLDAIISLLTVDIETEGDEEASESFDVLAARWALGDYRLSVTWEGLSDGQLSRPLGGGVLTADSNGDVTLIDDLGLNLVRFEEVVKLGADLRMQGKCDSDEPCGDLLVVTEGLTLTDACLSALQTEDIEEAACLLERRIEDIVENEGNTFWELDREIPEACRPSSGRIGYEVRAAREFSVVSNLKPYRVGPGESFGYGTATGATEPVHLKFQDVEQGNACASPSGLARGETGTLQLLDANRVSQGSTWPTGIWSLSQSIDGLDFDFDLTLPSDLKVWRSETHGTGILLSLTGSNRLIYFQPIFGEGATVETNPTDLFRTAEWYQDKSRFWLIQ